MRTVSLHEPLHAVPRPPASSARGIFGLRVGQAAGGAMVTMSSAPRAAAMRSSTGMVGTAPPASGRDRAGWVMPARAATSVWDRPSARRRSRTAWPIKNARWASSSPMSAHDPAIRTRKITHDPRLEVPDACPRSSARPLPPARDRRIGRPAWDHETAGAPHDMRGCRDIPQASRGERQSRGVLSGADLRRRVLRGGLPRQRGCSRVRTR